MSNPPSQEDLRSMIATVVAGMSTRIVRNYGDGVNLIYERTPNGRTFDVLSYSTKTAARRARTSGAANRRVVDRVMADPASYLR